MDVYDVCSHNGVIFFFMFSSGPWGQKTRSTTEEEASPNRWVGLGYAAYLLTSTSADQRKPISFRTENEASRAKVERRESPVPQTS